VTPTLPINISWENKVLTSRPCQTGRHQYLFCQFCLVFVFVYIARIYILFSQMKKVELVLTTNHGLLTSYTTRKVCFLTTNYGHLSSYNSENLFFWPHIMAICQAIQLAKFVFWPQIMDICINCRRRVTKYSFLMTQAQLPVVEGVQVEITAPGKLQLWRNHANFLRIYTRDCVHVRMT